MHLVTAGASSSRSGTVSPARYSSCWLGAQAATSARSALATLTSTSRALVAGECGDARRGGRDRPRLRRPHGYTVAPLSVVVGASLTGCGPLSHIGTSQQNCAGVNLPVITVPFACADRSIAGRRGDESGAARAQDAAASESREAGGAEAQKQQPGKSESQGNVDEC